jgi:hypothetical protein
MLSKSGNLAGKRGERQMQVVQLPAGLTGAVTGYKITCEEQFYVRTEVWDNPPARTIKECGVSVITQRYEHGTSATNQSRGSSGSGGAKLDFAKVCSLFFVLSFLTRNPTCADCALPPIKIQLEQEQGRPLGNSGRHGFIRADVHISKQQMQNRQPHV